MSTRRWTVIAVAAAVVFAGCASDTVVTTQRADQLGGATPPATDETADPTPSTTDPAEAPADPDQTADPADPADPDPSVTAAPVPDEPPATTIPAETTAVDFGPNKPSREYDQLVIATVADVERWLTDTYPAIYGEPYTPLQGKVFAAYPERPGDLPGCGEPSTSYQEVQQFVAFYCGNGDFIVYDDGPSGLLAQLAREFGPATIGIVVAHEFGHAIQLRSGALSRRLPTIATEQQADCFAGAWAGRAARGESPFVAFDDDDVRSGLIAMLEVRDPVGTNQFVPGGHGSGFDRVNAFQVGFQDGPSRCASLFDDPLPLTPTQFLTPDDQLSGGNAPFDELLEFIPTDLNLYWTTDSPLDVPDLEAHSVVVVPDATEIPCDDPIGDFGEGAVLCADERLVVLNQPVTDSLYQQSVFGDFSIGFLLGRAWAEAAQLELETGLTGEPRALLNDCLTGAWVKNVLPVDGGLPQPRLAERTASVSPGDLDEAIRTLILIGDATTDENVTGTPFEKIASFRAGVLDGVDACGL